MYMQLVFDIYCLLVYRCGAVTAVHSPGWCLAGLAPGQYSQGCRHVSTQHTPSQKGAGPAGPNHSGSGQKRRPSGITARSHCCSYPSASLRSTSPSLEAVTASTLQPPSPGFSVIMLVPLLSCKAYLHLHSRCAVVRVWNSLSLQCARIARM